MNKIVLTDAGIAELINAEQTGTAPVALVQVGLGTGKYDASATQTALSAEFKRLSTISGGDAGDNVIHLFVTDASSDAYTAFEVGIYTDSGTLLGVVSSRTEPIVQKAAGSTALLAIDFVLTNADPDSITVGDTNFVLPPATTEMQGIVELATAAETQAGTDTYRAVTPYALAQRTATTTRKGLMRFATTAEAETGTNTDSAVTPAGLKAVADKYLPLAGGTMTGAGNILLPTKSYRGRPSNIDLSTTNASPREYFAFEIVRNTADTTNNGNLLRIGVTQPANSQNINVMFGVSNPRAGNLPAGTGVQTGNNWGGIGIFYDYATNKSYPVGGGLSGWSADDNNVNHLASTSYVKNCLPVSIGSGTVPTYTNSNGVLTASTSTVGSADTPVYLNAGAITSTGKKFSDYLPLAGGVMTGSTIRRTGTSNWLRLTGGEVDNDDGASVLIFGRTHSSSAGVFTLSAYDGTSRYNLIGKPDGTFTWGGSTVLTVGNYSSYALPLVGGTMTGQIKSTNASVPVSFEGIGASSYRDIQAVRSDLNTRLGCVRFGTTATANIVTLGASDAHNSAPSGITITRELGDGTDPGAVTVSLASTPATTDGSSKAATTLYVKNCVPKSIGSGTVPTYTNSNGVLTASTSTVGSADTPVYLNAGEITSTGKKFSDYLPLAGGAMTGTEITRNVDNSWLRISGGTSYNAKGASLWLHGKDQASYLGQFRLRCSDGTNTCDLLGQPDGTLTWSGAVVTASDDSTKIATTAYVKDCVPKSKGGGTKLLYTNSNGVITESNSTVGSSSKPVYMSGGTLTECGSSLTDYLPLAGGTMSGTVEFSIDNALKRNSDTGEFRIFGDTDANAKGSVIAVRGKSRSSDAGSIYMRAGDGTDQKAFLLKPDGTFTWGGSNVYVANKNNVSTVGNAITRSGTSNWLRFTGGETDYTDGASIILFGKAHSSNAGVFTLSAYDGTNRYNLSGNPANGRMSWNGTFYNLNAENLFKVTGVTNNIGNGALITGTDANYGIQLQSTGITKGTTNATTYRGTVEWYGNTRSKWQDRLGMLEFSAVSNKSQAQLCAYNITSAENTATSYIRAIVDANGTAYTETLTPSTGDNTTKIATTAFVRGQVPASLGGGKKLLQTGSNGVITESNSTVGSANQPAYLGSGELKACTMNSASAAGLARITNQAFGVYGSNGQSDANNNTQGFHHGYIKFASGLIIQWGSVYCTTAGVDVTFETPFVNKPQMTMSYNTGGDHMKGYNSITNTGFHAWVNTDSSAAQMKWMAIGI